VNFLSIFIGFVISLLLIFIPFIIITPLERCFPLHPEQKIFRKQFWNDVLLHHVMNNILVTYGSIVFFAVTFGLLSYMLNAPFHDALQSQPLPARIIEAVIIADICGYFAHRLVHTVPCLWRFHSVHHSIQEMDWVAGIRNHPIDVLVERAVQAVPVVLLGFNFTDTAIVFTVIGLIGIFAHSNIKWTFGPLYYFYVTPMYHHVHHSGEKRHYDKNFAGIVPFIDMIFGTFEKPEWPAKYGVEEPVPSIWPLQMVYPFKFWKICCCFKSFQTTWDVEAEMTESQRVLNRFRVACFVQVIPIFLNLAFIWFTNSTFQSIFRWACLPTALLPVLGILSVHYIEKPISKRLLLVYIIINFVFYFPMLVGAGYICVIAQKILHLIVVLFSLWSGILCSWRSIKLYGIEKVDPTPEETLLITRHTGTYPHNTISMV